MKSDPDKAPCRTRLPAHWDYTLLLRTPTLEGDMSFSLHTRPSTHAYHCMLISVCNTAHSSTDSTRYSSSWAASTQASELASLLARTSAMLGDAARGYTLGWVLAEHQRAVHAPSKVQSAGTRLRQRMSAGPPSGPDLRLQWRRSPGLQSRQRHLLLEGPHLPSPFRWCQPASRQPEAPCCRVLAMLLPYRNVSPVMHSRLMPRVRTSRLCDDDLTARRPAL